MTYIYSLCNKKRQLHYVHLKFKCIIPFDSISPFVNIQTDVTYILFVVRIWLTSISRKVMDFMIWRLESLFPEDLRGGRKRKEALFLQ